MTPLRYLGYCFNPISIYYCFAEDGHTLEAFLVEIHNTPWGEEYLRAFDARTDQFDGKWHLYRLDKEFHVSPFMPMDIVYDWRFTAPEEQLAARMTNNRQGAKVFEAFLHLRRQPLTGSNLAGAAPEVEKGALLNPAGTAEYKERTLSPMNQSEQTCNHCPHTESTTVGFIDKLARSLVLKSLTAIRHGHLILVDRDEHREFGYAGSALTVTLKVQHPGFYRRVAFGGTIAAGESYMDGLWTCSDLTALVRIMVRNQEAQQQLEGGPARLAVPLQRLLHHLRDNTRTGSRRNIAAHYDLGNDFYQLFLDPTMAYSCGIFERDDSTLEDASTAKFDRICRKLGLTPDMKVLEIGTGWGGFAIHAARNYGCHVTTTTISQKQHDLAAEKITARGLNKQITLLQQDYRDLTGQFDRLVSIEMIEAVGHRHLPRYFRVCSDRLKPDGAALIQAITMPDHYYERYLNAPDFINRYIFPGSCCPSLHAISEAVARETDLRLTHLEDLSPHYARTLREWKIAFHANLEQVRDLGFDERFIRMWEFYLCYCEGGFAERFTGDLQLLFTKPGYREEPLLHPLGRSEKR